MKSTFSGPRTTSRQIPLRRALIRVGATLLLAVGSCVSVNVPASASTSPALSRYPYLTDSTQSSITVNWATSTSATTGSVQWGPVGSCAANTTVATRTAITVISTAEYQWAAPIPVSPDTTYCYRVLLAGTDLLGTDPSPQFTSQVAAGSTAPFSFAVFGDWGQAYAGGINADQTNLLSQISSSGARFAVMTGDTAYPGGGQGEYGDLQQSGVDSQHDLRPDLLDSARPVHPRVQRRRESRFHRRSGSAAELARAERGGGVRWTVRDGKLPFDQWHDRQELPSAWYAVDAGNTRLYMLTAAWADGNIGSASTPYDIDQLAHWRPGAAEYEWLKGDLLAHPNAVKMAFWHYPLFADSSGQPSDAFLQGGSGTLAGVAEREQCRHRLQRSRARLRTQRPGRGRNGQLCGRQRRRRPGAGQRLQRIRRLRHRLGWVALRSRAGRTEQFAGVRVRQGDGGWSAGHRHTYQLTRRHI